MDTRTDADKIRDLTETVDRLTAAIQRHKDVKAHRDYAYWPDQYDYQLWAQLER